MLQSISTPLRYDHRCRSHTKIVDRNFSDRNVIPVKFYPPVSHYQLEVEGRKNSTGDVVDDVDGCLFAIYLIVKCISRYFC
jgi:hypothetical protein